MKKIISVGIALLVGLLIATQLFPAMAQSTGNFELVDLADRGGDGSFYRLVEHSGNVGRANANDFAVELRQIGGNDLKRQVLVVSPSNGVIAEGFSRFSDRRLKENIKELTGALEKIEKIHGVSYQWKDLHKDDASPNKQESIGVIAQEVEKVFPEAVRAVGNERIKAVDYDMLVAVLIESTKELKEQKDQEILQLSQKVQQLETKIQELNR